MPTTSPHPLTRRIVHHPAEVDAQAWDRLLALQPGAGTSGPFMRHANLLALHTSGCATPDTGWTPHWLTLWQGDALRAATPLYLKTHSYGEYVFDWAWANAHHQHGLPYYPKGLVAVPFMPVPGPRLLADSPRSREALVQALTDEARALGLSSVHVLFASDPDLAASEPAGWMERKTVQFHWSNARPTDGLCYENFDDFLGFLSQDKRKKIRQEQRRVREAGVHFTWSRGAGITSADWDLFFRCYERTYAEHGNPPYLNRAFFQSMQDQMADHWLLFKAHNAAGRAVACSLVALSDGGPSPAVAFGRYWGALERVDCLHFDACYHQPLAWCIEHGVQRFEGGAQGEHKMARALMPVITRSAHWLAHPAFAGAVARFLEREGEGVSGHLVDLRGRSPFKTTGPVQPS
jgi:predicted N-acyltransferase